MVLVCPSRCILLAWNWGEVHAEMAPRPGQASSCSVKYTALAARNAWEKNQSRRREQHVDIDCECGLCDKEHVSQSMQVFHIISTSVGWWSVHNFAPTSFVLCCLPTILDCIPSFLPHVLHMSVTTPKLFLGYYLAHSFLRHPLQVALSPVKISNALCPLPLWHCFFSISSTTISPHAIPCFLVVKCPPADVSHYCNRAPHNKYSYFKYIVFTSLREKIELTIRPPHSSIPHSPHHLIIK